MPKGGVRVALKLMLIHSYTAQSETVMLKAL
jgi:hypothetical protein